MPALPRQARGGGADLGGIVGYPTDRVYREIALLGRYVPWTLTELLELDHAERVRWLREVTSVVEAHDAGGGR